MMVLNKLYDNCILHIFQVYDTIALHFSDTRSKIWPKVRTFIESFAAGSILVDVGCGNGKYFGVNQNIFQVSTVYISVTKELVCL